MVLWAHAAASRSGGRAERITYFSGSRGCKCSDGFGLASAAMALGWQVLRWLWGGKCCDGFGLAGAAMVVWVQGVRCAKFAYLPRRTSLQTFDYWEVGAGGNRVSAGGYSKFWGIGC